MSGNITKEICYQVLQNYLHHKDVTVQNYSTVSRPNRNFILEIVTTNKNEENTITFLGKSKKSVPLILQKFTQENNIITQEVLYSDNDIIILEDLKLRNFTNEKYLNGNNITLVLKVLAKLHALGFANQENLQENILINFEDPKTIELVSSLLDGKYRVDEKINEHKAIMLSTKFTKTLCHNNLVRDNFMFRYNNTNIIQCKLVNFDDSCRAPPIWDVLQLILCNTDKFIQQFQYKALLKCYYEFLKEEMIHQLLKIEDFVPEKDWHLQCHEFLVLVKLHCCLEQKSNLLDELREDLNCPDLSRQDCYSILRNKLKDQNFDFIDYQLMPIGTKSGFLGDYNFLTITYRESLCENQLKLFMKCKPNATTAKLIVDESNSFAKESFVYHIFAEECYKYGIKEIDECVPIWYFEREGKFMVFEDMQAQNFRTLSTLKPYEYDTLCMVIKKLAKFHGCCLIYEEKVSEEKGRQYRVNENYLQFFNETLLVNDENHYGGRLMQNGLRSIYYCATELFPEGKCEDFEEIWTQLCASFFTSVTTSQTCRNVISHGDLWSNNILIKLKDDKPIDCRIVDFQVIRYCPPVHDLLSILHLTTVRDIRLKYETELKDLYYQELKQVLRSYNYDIGQILPIDQFLKVYNEMRVQMIVQAPHYYMFQTCTSQQVADVVTNDEEFHKIFYVDRREFINRMCAVSPIYKERLREKIFDLHELCSSLQNRT